MSRLIELLNEKAPLPAGADKSTEYTRHSAVGNLFRLMLVINKEHPFVQLGAQNLVSKMLTDLPKDQLAELEKLDAVVTRLQKSYNAIKRALVDGESLQKKKTLRTTYFNDLFTVLFPLTGVDKLQGEQSSLVKAFATNTEKTIPIQRRTISLIGHALISNKGAPINEKDRMWIQGYINGLDAMDGFETATGSTPLDIEDISKQHDPVEDERQPTDSVTRVVNSKKTLEELKKIKADGEKVLAAIKKKSASDPAKLSDMLKTNDQADTFKVELTGNNEPVNDVINSKINIFYHQTKLDHGHEVANFATKLVTDAIKRLSEDSNYLNSIQGDVNFNIEKIENGLRISMFAGQSGPTANQFFYVNSFTTAPDGKFEVHLDKIHIPIASQDKGLNKKIFKDTLELYKAEGVDRITLQANVDVGGYAWFRYGFVPKDQKQIDGIAVWIERIGYMIEQALAYNSKELSQFIEANTSPDNLTTGVKNMIALIASGKNTDSSTKIPKLFEVFAQKFKTTFSKPGALKDLGSKIATGNFEEYKIGNKVYSISYKALFSIQSLHAGNTRVLPMIRGTHLDWSGVLDMKNLDDTEAYLNMKKS